MKNYLKAFVHEDDGAELVEYAIVVGIVAVVAAAVFVVVKIVRDQVARAGEEIGKLNIDGDSSGGGTGGLTETPGGAGIGGSSE